MARFSAAIKSPVAPFESPKMGLPRREIQSVSARCSGGPMGPFFWVRAGLRCSIRERQFWKAMGATRMFMLTGTLRAESDTERRAAGCDLF